MLISEEYKDIQEKLHQDPKYGAATAYKAVIPYLQRMRPRSIVDYGAGKGKLKGYLRQYGISARYIPYDPAVREFSADPQTGDVVICMDVCEHIEEEYVDNVFRHMNSKFTHFCILAVACYPAKKIMEDGRNAHVLIRQPSWWFAKFWEHFDVIEFRTAVAKLDDKFRGHEALAVCRKKVPGIALAY
ncbi:methyltransferase domain-containing protein [Thalassobaculum sp.]|uniref:methyltransferase domain-containing protein n=1 Tax=Thalassobaculum sp. TaxID=2022740 RepID=UPI003B5B47C7